MVCEKFGHFDKTGGMQATQKASVKDSKFQVKKGWFKNLGRGISCTRQNSADHKAPEKSCLGMVKEVREKAYLLE